VTIDAIRPDEATLREAICAAGRRLGSRGLISAGEGNLSFRLGGGSLLTTPTGRRKDELVPEDLVVVPLDPGSGSHPGDKLPPGSRPSSDIAIHRAIYRARPDVVAVAHAHLPASMALTLAGETPDPAALPETAFHLPRLPLVPYGAMGSEELAARIAAAFTADGPPLPLAVLLERHGAIAVGAAGPTVAGAGTGGTTDMLEAALVAAVDRLELVDVLCRTWLDAVLVRGALGRPGRIEPPGG
jgi:L-fuculose-phosphate aldolase